MRVSAIFVLVLGVALLLIFQEFFYQANNLAQGSFWTSNNLRMGSTVSIAPGGSFGEEIIVKINEKEDAPAEKEVTVKEKDALIKAVVKEADIEEEEEEKEDALSQKADVEEKDENENEERLENEDALTKEATDIEEEGEDDPVDQIDGNITEEARYKKLISNPDENSTAGVDAAPRTYTGEYNAMEEGGKYFIYSPANGMGNQIMEIVWGSHLAKEMNRTLLVPMLGTHTNMYYNYERLPPEGLFPMDRILDFPHLAKYCAVVPLNVSVVNFTNAQPTHLVHEIFHAKRQFWLVKDMINATRPHQDKQIIYLHGAAIYNRWMSEDIFDQVKQFVRFSPYLRWRATEVVRQAFPPEGRFNAIHVRLGDYMRYWPKELGARQKLILKNAARHTKRDNSLLMYLSSDEPYSDNFDTLRTMFNITAIDMLPGRLMRDYAQMFSSEFQMDMLGVLDQLICSQAEDFTPTVWSSFSRGILAIRANRTSLFPEIANISQLE